MAALVLRRLVFGILPLFLLGHGCAAGGDDEVQGDSDGDGGEPRERIAFEGIMVPIKLGPLEQRRIPIVVRPAAVREIRFGLLPGEDGGPNDALLDHHIVETDESGRAEVILTASSAPTSFRLRASTGGISTTVDVEINASNEVTLEVVAVYSGDRQAPLWSASVFSGVTCETLSEGNVTAERYGESPSRTIMVEAVPVGSVAVVARAGHYVEGCATLNEVVEGEKNQVFVPVNDRPIQLASSELELEFGFESVSPEWRSSIDFVIEAARSAMLNTAADDVGALLDTMQESLPSSKGSQFASLRSEKAWDTVLADKLGDRAPVLLRDTAAAWMRAGQEALAAPDAFRAEVWSDPDAKDDLEGATHALMRFVQVGGYPPEDAGFPELAPAVWSADSRDTLLLSGAVAWFPSRLLGALAEGPAKAAYPTAESVAEALGFELGCSVVASALVTASPGGVYGAVGDDPACLGTCTAKLCRKAVATMWERATLASGEAPQHFEFSATGAASVGSEAEVVSLTGTWVGKDRDQTEAATAGGPLIGTAR